eukprot:1714442-Pyramimonas_sp.AAC.1
MSGAHCAASAFERPLLETPVFDTGPLEGGCRDLPQQPQHFLVGRRIGAALDDRGLEGGIDVERGCPSSAGDCHRTQP